MGRESESKIRSEKIKFLCSYGGKILPRSGDGKLRYVGGLTRVLSVDRSISFTELMVKLVEFCGYSVTLRCQLPNGDLETLISIRSEEDLGNLIELYDDEGSSANSKIRSVLSPPKSLKQISPPLSTPSSLDLDLDLSSTKYQSRSQSCSPPLRFVRYSSGKPCFHHCQCCGGGSPTFFPNISHSNYWYY